jgi:hypothetical protein
MTLYQEAGRLMKTYWRSGLVAITGVVLALGGTAPPLAVASPVVPGGLIGSSGITEVAALVGQHSDVFGGLILDSRGATLTVYTASGSGRPAQAQSLLRNVLDRVPTTRRGVRVIVEERPWSAADLDAVRAGIPSHEPFASAAGKGLSTWYVDPASNTVRVGLTAVTPAARKAAAQTYGSAVTLETRSRYSVAKKVIPLGGRLRSAGDPGAVGPAVAPSPSRLLDTQPYFGGVRIGVLANNLLTLCTAAFPNSARTRMLTAGHCFPSNAVVQQGYLDTAVNAFITTGIVGRIDWRQWGNNRIDAETVNSQGQGTPLAAFMYTSLQGSKPIGAQVISLNGATVCADGSFTGENCRGVVDATNLCANIVDGTTTLRVCGLDSAHSSDGSRLVQPGDSGGPVYSYDPTHSNVQPTGVVSAGNVGAGQPGNQMLFTDILQLCNQNPPGQC